MYIIMWMKNTIFVRDSAGNPERVRQGHLASRWPITVQDLVHLAPYAEFFVK